MSEPLSSALDQIRNLIEQPDTFVRAVASGRRKSQPVPGFVKVELRPVQLKTGIHLQWTRHGPERPTTTNTPFNAMSNELDELLAQPYANWLVETTDSTIQMRVTKRGEALIHKKAENHTQRLDHDREPPHLMSPDDPLFQVLGAGAAKRRQVDAFLRAIDPLLRDSTEKIRIADLGCGNAYLTFALSRYLETIDRSSLVTGIDIRDDQRERNNALAKKLDRADQMSFISGSIADAPLSAVDMVVALHACDTATDDALARGVTLGAKHIIAAPCCHHDVAAQLRKSTAPIPYTSLTSDGILRERFADVLTDAIRATLLQLHGYRVDVIEFIDSAHTPRNTLLRATYTGDTSTAAKIAEYTELARQWNITPKLSTLIGVPTRSR